LISSSMLVGYGGKIFCSLQPNCAVTTASANDVSFGREHMASHVLSKMLAIHLLQREGGWCKQILVDLI